MKMPRRNQTKTTRPREIDDTEAAFDTFAQQMDYWHIPHTGMLNGRRTWRVMSGGK